MRGEPVTLRIDCQGGGWWVICVSEEDLTKLLGRRPVDNTRITIEVVAKDDDAPPTG